MKQFEAISLLLLSDDEQSDLKYEHFILLGEKANVNFL